jgi:1D-myo-inositol 3-kinase
MVAQTRNRETRLNEDLRFDYTTIGHVTIDVLEDGSRRAGGGAFYSALQAARLGQRTRIITQGRAAEIEALLEPYRDELDVEILAAEQTTTLQTRGSGATRKQSLLAWAGPISAELDVSSAIVHLAPVARETPLSWSGRSDFIGLTPQGLLREWPPGGGEISLTPPADGVETLAARCDALVLSANERASCTGLIAAASDAGAAVLITDGPAPTTLVLAGGATLARDVRAVPAGGDDLGAGDVFAAALFVELARSRGALEATDFANAASAVRMQGLGAAAIGDRGTIEARLVSALR